MTRPARPESRGGGVLARRRPPSPHVETKRRAKRARILESAVRSFAAKGFYGTSMDDIAEELLLTRGSLYYYFKDKEEILALCHETALEAMLDVTGRVRASQLPPDQALHRIVVEHARVMVDKFHGTALALEFDALDPKRRAAVVGGPRRLRAERPGRDRRRRSRRRCSGRWTPSSRRSRSSGR